MKVSGQRDPQQIRSQSCRSVVLDGPPTRHLNEKLCGIGFKTIFQKMGVK